MSKRFYAAQIVASNWRLRRRLPRLTALAVSLDFNMTRPAFIRHVDGIHDAIVRVSDGGWHCRSTRCRRVPARLPLCNDKGAR